MHRKFSWEERTEYLKKYGCQATAYSTLQPGMAYFDLPEVGYIAYRQVGKWLKTTHVLGDPIAAPDQMRTLLAAFLQQFPNAIFYQVQRHTARCLHKHFGYYMNECGVESIIHLRDFSLSGRKMQDMRRYRNVCERNKVEVFESSLEAVGAPLIRRISSEWIRHKIVSGNELSFLARPLVLESESDVRYFFAKKSGEIIAFAVFDPIYGNEGVAGYQNVIQRSRQHVPKGTLDFVNLHAIETFRNEGRKFLSLGLSPLSSINALQEAESPVTRRLFKIFYDKGNFAYGFKQLEFHKERYRAVKVKNYFMSRSLFPAKSIIDGYRLCRVLTGRNVVELFRKQLRIPLAKRRSERASLTGRPLALNLLGWRKANPLPMRGE